ncbi:hypothetical protein DEG99_01905 [Salmonella enterica]|nr:hypothetical protein [Salmonella enterica]
MASELESFIKRDNARYVASFSNSGKVPKEDFYSRVHLVAQWRQTESVASYDDLYTSAYNDLVAEINASGLIIEN